MNADATVSADSARKLKQVEHLLGLLRPSLEEALAEERVPVVWDLNCGSSYLGLLLLEAVRQEFGRELRLYSVDRDPARVDASRRRASDLGFPDAVFLHSSVAAADLPAKPALALSLHGCDTATDEALLRAVEGGAARIAVVPCCQRELRTLVGRVHPHLPFLRDAASAQDYCALLTDVARAAALRVSGYRTDVAEFTGFEHTLKNRLIRATHTGKSDLAAESDLKALLAACSAPPSFSPLIAPRAARK
jgi:hypothetical protein